MRGRCRSSMKAWGSRGVPGDSLGGGAGVRSSDLISEKTVEWGRGRTTRLLLDFEPSDSSHGAECERERECVMTGLPAEGREDSGYRSKRMRRSSMMSCRVGTSPGFLSEKSNETSLSNGDGQAARSALHPTTDVESAFTQRSSS